MTATRRKFFSTIYIMKKLLLAIVAVVALSMPAAAQFRFGLKAGVAVDKMSFNKEVFNADNRAGFTGGAMIEFTAPIIGVGMDASVLYVNRGIDMVNDDTDVITKGNRSYIDIPINLKWKIGLPLIGKIITPFLTTGPDFSFLCSKKNFSNALHNRKFDFAWNVGAGVELLRHLQIAASYGIGITKSASGNDALNGGLSLSGKNRVWTITAAYLF